MVIEEEIIMNYRLTAILLIGLFLLTGCSFSATTLPTPTVPAAAPLVFITTETPSPIPSIATAVTVFTPTATPMPAVSANVCTDPQVIALIDSLKRAMLNNDGALLSSLVSPVNGMEVRWVRYGNIVTYTREQALFLYETTFEANWGDEPGSGMPKQGAFHDVIVPDLLKVFNQPYTLHCNELRYGGASYDVRWPYDRDFYSIYFTGTDQYGYLDWHTWVAGIEYVDGKPFIYALLQFFWEP
jgi:hypothetical protein